ncbi:hypothetical protein [Roseiconus lacunae]|uniref:Uncharacterized protein n=1 Tax=Roseiconus lacunae TaxID=2605694 RepID=A0ABT7PK38_9BACT|nr:hypothetical protein [Roseiconus lacunae]MDM4016862.1 hypothetical protein [Roseiconus lacunae]
MVRQDTCIENNVGAIRQRWAMLVCAMACVLVGGSVFAQPPGTYPPPEVVLPSPTAANVEPGKIPIKGMMVFDVSRQLVYVGPLTYEKWWQLEQESENQSRRFVFESVQISGRVDGNRAELSIEVRVAVDATGEELVEIPMAMENFHRLAPAEFYQGRENGNKLALDIDGQTGAQQLLAAVKSDTVVAFRMQMAARVENNGLKSLQFRLPPAPTHINLLTDANEVVGQIPDRDDEVIETSVDESGKTRFNVVSSGGNFTLQWGKQDGPVVTPQLESNSDVSVTWNTPQEPFIQNIEMTIRDPRGPISNFQLRLPKNATMLENPRLIGGGQFGQLETAQTNPDDPSLYSVILPKAERQKSIALSFRVELESESPTAADPLRFQVPVVVGAVRSRGMIRLIAGPEYRLRWRELASVSKIAGGDADDSSNGENVHQFQFIRSEFNLPLWLDATRREIRVTNSTNIELRDNYANLTLDIRSAGNSSPNRLLTVDMAGWQILSVENARTGARIARYDRDEFVEIENAYTGMEESIPILIKARRVFEPTDDEKEQVHKQIDLTIPRIVDPGDGQEPVIVTESTLELSSRGRRALVVDLGRSENLQRQPTDDSEQDDSIRRFAIVPADAESRLIGDLVEQPPRLVFESFDAKVQLEVDEIDTVVRWKIQSQTDLEGRLRIAVPKLFTAATGLTPTDTVTAASGTKPSDQRFGRSVPWTVLVQGRPASLVPVVDGAAGLGNVAAVGITTAANASSDAPANSNTADTPVSNSALGEVDYFDVVSDALTDGTMELRFQRAWAVTQSQQDQSANATFAMPYPLVQDITLRGDVNVELIGNQQHVLEPVDDLIDDSVLRYRSLPKSPIRLKLSPQARIANELLVGKVFIRTIVNEVTQHDQIIAVVDGAGEFVIELVGPLEPDAKVLIDGKPAAFRLIDQTIQLRLPKETKSPHVIDVRLWQDRTASGLIEKVSPLVTFGPGLQEVYWQLTTPPNSHLLGSKASVGRLMRWTFDRWLVRQPLLAETALVNRMVQADAEFVELTPMPNSGNRYLFSSMDDRAFSAYTGTRTLIWLVVASLVVMCTAMLTYFPVTRHPVTLMMGIVLLVGLLFIAPDATVLLGQVSMLALIVVAVMLAIRSLVVPTPSRVLSSSQISRASASRFEPSTRNGRQAEFRSPSSIAVTHSIGPEDVTSAPDEVSS